MKNESYDIDRIIARHLEGSTTPAEQETLQAWLCNSESNRAYFSAIANIPKPNVEKAWQKFAQHMQQEQSAPNKNVRLWNFSNTTIRYAAAITVFIGLSIFTWIKLSSPSVQVIAKNSQAATQQHTLQDSSTVLLSKNSTLAYIGTYSKGKREVQLKGEAFFDVSATGNGQFLVHAEETLIKDIGTAFNVQAYPESDSVIVFVQSGEVQFYAKGNEGILVKAGESGIYNKHAKTFTHFKSGENNVAISSTKLFVFKDKPLSEAVALINKEYNVHINISDTATAKQTISVTFDNERIEEIVEIIGETMHLNIAQKDSIYLLKKK